MAFFDTYRGMQVLPPVHFDVDDKPQHIVQLPDDHLAFQPMPTGQQWSMSQQGIPTGYIAQVVPPATKADIELLRKEAYSTRSDPLYMHWQYDQTPEAEQLWRAEVAAIKQEYPWPA